jgi:hypothetical protein
VRHTKAASGLDLLVSVQVFHTPVGGLTAK